MHRLVFYTVMITGVLFDLDETLLDRTSSLRLFVAAQYRQFAAALAHVPAPVYTARLLELDQHGHVGKSHVYQQLVAEFAITGVAWQTLEQDYATQFHHCCVPFPGMLRMLEDLRAHGYRMGLVTNGVAEFQQRTLVSLGIASMFTAVLVSGSEGVRKPEPEIFYRALRQLGVHTHESVFVGDHPDADVVGAQRVGMQAIWKQTAHWPAPPTCTAIVTHLQEVPSIIQRLTAASP